jgi:hypothetical protein
MQETIKFGIDLPLDIGYKLKHLKEKSCYNNNYYELPRYGDWIDYGDSNNNILYVDCHEDENCYTYYFGRFENDKFIKVIGWTTDRDILENISIDYATN